MGLKNGVRQVRVSPMRFGPPTGPVTDVRAGARRLFQTMNKLDNLLKKGRPIQVILFNFHTLAFPRALEFSELLCPVAQTETETVT